MGDLGNWKWITLLLCLIAELCIYGQKRGDFLVSQSIYCIYAPVNSENNYKQIISGPLYGVFFENETFISGGQIEVGVSYFIKNNIGFLAESGYFKTQYYQKGSEYTDYGGGYKKNVIQDYNFRKIGLGLNYIMPVSNKIDINAKYIYSFLHHYNNYDSYFLILKKYHFQHSIKLSIIFNDNSSLRFGCEFIGELSTKNMAPENIEKVIYIKPLTLGLGFVMAYTL